MIIQKRRAIIKADMTKKRKEKYHMENFDLKRFLHDLKTFLEEMYEAIKNIFTK